MTRRNFIYKSSLLLTSLSLPLSAAVDFKNLKIGYLPISDHLLIIAKEVKNAAFTPVKFSSWADLSEAFRAKSIDGAFILTPLALRLKEQGLNIKALFAAHRNGSALVVKKGVIGQGEKKDFNALKGLKIAIPSRFSTHYLLLAILFKQKGLSFNDVKLIDMPPSEMIFALSNKSIDAFIVAEPFNLLAQDMNVADVFILSKDIINNHICCTFCVNDELIKNQRSQIEKLSKDFFETAQFINKNPHKAAEFSTKLLGHKAPLIENLLAQGDRVVYKNLVLSPKDIEQTIQTMRQEKVADIKFAYTDFVDSSFIKALE